MILENDNLYHIYNQGNNRERIFFNRENYLFFLKKIRTHILPYADVLAWCLMPNHFHLLVYVRDNAQDVASTAIQGETLSTTCGATQSRITSRTQTSFPLNCCRSNNTVPILNKNIGIMQASYTRAINIQENRTGSLFRQGCKALCLSKTDEITPAYFETSFGTYINARLEERQYPTVCFHYIHNNPVVAKLVKHAGDWEFSSYRDYFANRDDSIINKERAKEFICIRLR